MEFKGTKGEWIIDKYNSISCNGKIVLVGSGLGFNMHEYEEPTANAKLIASAPDLLEALQEIIPIFEALVRESKQPTKADEYNCHKKAMKAIEKALK